MNDGTLDYKNYHSVDSLAFGHCDYPYRNLGRPSKLHVKQEGGVFEVKVDDKPCFASDKVDVSKNYHIEAILMLEHRSNCLRDITSVSQLLRPRLRILLKRINSFYRVLVESLEKSLDECTLHPEDNPTTILAPLKLAQSLLLLITLLNFRTFMTV